MLALVHRDGQDLPLDAINGANWQLSDIRTFTLLKKMESAGIPLGHYVKNQIYYGIKTGFNAAFVITGAKRAELIAADPESAEIIKPLAVGDDIRRWRIEKKDKWLIVTKIGVDMARYPAVFNHLSQWQPQLEARSDQGNHWWELRSCAYYATFEKSKIVYPQIMMEPRFTFDSSQVYTNQKCFIIDTEDIYLLGLLNSRAVWSYLKVISVSFGDPEQRGRLEPRRDDILSIRIPNASDADRNAISTLVQKCLNAKGMNCQQWEKEIDERVAALYGL